MNKIKKKHLINNLIFELKKREMSIEQNFEILDHFHKEGLSWESIASVLKTFGINCSYNSLKVKMGRLRRKRDAEIFKENDE